VRRCAPGPERAASRSGAKLVPSPPVGRPVLLVVAIGALFGCSGDAPAGAGGASATGSEGAGASGGHGCFSTETTCDGKCVDVMTHPEHCGACGNACATGPN